VLTPEAAGPLSGPRAATLFTPEELARAGLAADAVVLSVDGAAPTPPRGRRRGSVLVRAQREGHPPAFHAVTR
jgi:hypothetical protein